MAIDICTDMFMICLFFQYIMYIYVKRDQQDSNSSNLLCKYIDWVYLVFEPTIVAKRGTICPTNNKKIMYS